ELHTVAVTADQVAQEADRQQILPFLFLLDDDLGQYRAGQVLAGLGVVDDEIAALLDHLGEVVEGHIAARRGVVEPAIGVFLDDDGLFPARLVAAGSTHAPGIPPHTTCCSATIPRFAPSGP